MGRFRFVAGNIDEKFVKLWQRASEIQKQEIFYYSLFDFKSFEEDEVDVTIFNLIKDIQDKLISLIKEIDRNFFSKTEKKKFVEYAGQDRLLRSILIYELKKEKIIVKTSGNKFPDLMTEHSVHIEIKRQTSTGNMGDDFWGVDKKDCKKLIFLIFFPVLSQDDEERVVDLTKGYYFIKKFLGAKRDTDVLICCPTKSNFRVILEKIIKCLKNPNWSKNG